MAIPKPQARLNYYKDYPPFGEGYALEIFLDDEWQLDRFYSLQHCIIDKDSDEKEFIHFSILNRLKELQAWGYEVIL